MAKLSLSLTRAGSVVAQDLVGQIIESARVRGIDQLTLARRAGISAEALSRLKKGGRCRLATALSLARAAGFRTLEVAGRNQVNNAAWLAARKLSAGRRQPIAPGELVSALAAREPARRYHVYLRGFFEELPIEAVHDVILDENLEFGELASLASKLGVEGETVEWLEEMAEHGVEEVARAGVAAPRRTR